MAPDKAIGTGHQNFLSSDIYNVNCWVKPWAN